MLSNAAYAERHIAHKLRRLDAWEVQQAKGKRPPIRQSSIRPNWSRQRQPPPMATRQQRHL